MKTIIDMHTHAYPDAIAPKAKAALDQFYHFKTEADATFSSLAAECEKAGVGVFLLCSAATSARQVRGVNDWLASHKGPHTVIFGTMHQDFEDFEGELKRMESMGISGVKLHPDYQQVAVDDPRLMRLYELLEGRMPVLLHVGDKRYQYSNPARVARVVDAFPKLRVIGAHLGGYSEWDNAERDLLGKNLHVDTSSSLWAMSPERAVELIRHHGADKVFFGSDSPVSTQSAELARFMKLNLTDREREMILYENAARFLSLTE